MASTNLSIAKAKAVAKPAAKTTKSTNSGSSTNQAINQILKGLTSSLGALGTAVASMGAVGAAGGGSGVATGKPGDAGYFTLDQINAYMAANNGNLPPGLNINVSGITASDLSNLVNSYNKTGTTGSTSSTSTSQDAFSLLIDTFTSYGLGGLASVIQGYMKQNMGPYEAALLLKQTPEYKARFAGNETRRAAGLDVLTEAEYISLEKQYGNLMTQYGVKNLANQKQFASLIGADISATELNSRLDLAVAQVQQVDPTVKQTLQTFYPHITDANLVSYFLNPSETLPMLQKQVSAADIGAAAVQQKVPGIGVTRAEELAGLGVTYAQAQKGYGEVAASLPTAKILSSIYAPQTGTTYGQTDLENQYLLGSGEAALKQRELNKLEAASFSGQSGIDIRTAALGKSIQGSF